jgi:hypothetical protein
VDVQLYRIAGAQNECAGIFESPSDVGNLENRVESEFRTGQPHGDRNYHFVVPPVQAECAFHLNLGFALRLEIALDFQRNESNFRIFLALENFLVHFIIAAVASALAAASIHHKEARELSRKRIERQFAALQRECTVYAVQRSLEGKVDRASNRIELK